MTFEEGWGRSPPQMPPNQIFIDTTYGYTDGTSEPLSASLKPLYADYFDFNRLHTRDKVSHVEKQYGLDYERTSSLNFWGKETVKRLPLSV